MGAVSCLELLQDQFPAIRLSPLRTSRVNLEIEDVQRVLQFLGSVKGDDANHILVFRGQEMLTSSVVAPSIQSHGNQYAKEALARDLVDYDKRLSDFKKILDDPQAKSLVDKDLVPGLEKHKEKKFD